MRYTVWRHVPADARRAAAEAVYCLALPGLRCGDPSVRRTWDGRCPLGVALSAMGVPPVGYSTGWVDPDAPMVAEALGLPNACAASAFINAWDAGRIDPAALPALLAVPRHEVAGT